MKTENPLDLFGRHPEFLVLAVNLLVYRLGGQVVFTSHELADATAEYTAKVCQDFDTETVTITTHTRSGHKH